MKINVSEILEKFMLTPAPCGYEAEMAYAMKSYFEQFCDEVWIDNVGNCIGKIAGKDSSQPRSMFFGHMDSLGLMVRRIDEYGFIGVSRLGGITEKVLSGTTFLIRTDDKTWVPAVVGPKAHHVTPPEEKYVVEKVEEIYLDVGARNAEEVRAPGIHEGCPIVYKPRCEKLLNGRLSGTSVDNRGACACLVKMAELLHEERPQGDVYLVGTVWEEFNLRGAVVAAHVIKPAVAVSLDVALSGDTNDLRDKFTLKMSEGPAANLYTFHGRGTLNGVIAHEPLYHLAKKAAAEKELPLQSTISFGMLMDSSYIQFEGEGVASLDMGFPTRYTHTPVETCDPKDVEQLACVCSEMARQINRAFQFKRF